MKNIDYVYKSRLFFFYVMGCLIGLIPSCNEDEQKPEDFTRKKALLTFNWTLVSSEKIIINEASQKDTITKDTIDHFASLELCERDNFYRFKEDQTYSFHSNKKLCDEDQEAVIREGKWEEKNDFAQLMLDSALYNIKTLNSDEMELQREKKKEDRKVIFNKIYHPF